MEYLGRYDGTTYIPCVYSDFNVVPTHATLRKTWPPKSAAGYFNIKTYYVDIFSSCL